MSYVALYRKWRPKDFADLVGQDHISHTLAQAIKTGKIGHAYLFSGPRGTGKTSTAKILAKALNCEHGPTAKPCNKCSCCQKINNNTFMDVYEIDAASNRGIDEIRDLRETVKFAPADGKYKVYIIDEVHMLTAEAFNALLKTLEEPPEHVVFILATTEIQKVPATIQSRCQRYDFKRISNSDIKKQLKKIAAAINIEAEDDAISLIAIHADGGMRDAVSLLDQCTSLSAEKLTAENVRNILGIVGYEYISKITDAIISNKPQEILHYIEEILATGKAISQLLTELAFHWRSLMIYKAAGEAPSDYQEDISVLARQSSVFKHEQLTAMIDAVYEALNQIRWSPQPRVTVEMALLRLCSPHEVVLPKGRPAEYTQLQAMAQKISHLENVIYELKNASHTAVPVAAKQIRTTANSGGGQKPIPASPASPSVAKAGSAAQQPLPPHNNVPPSPKELKDAQAIWQAVLTALKEQHKIPALACVEKAQVCELQNDQLVLSFKAPFLKARTEKADYKSLIEGILLTKTGRQINLVCTMAQASLPPLPPSEKNSPANGTATKKTVAPAAENNLSTEEKQRLQKAVNIFGDNIIEENEEH